MSPVHPTGRAAAGPVDPPDGLYRAVESMMAAHHIPGLSLAVVNPDGLLYAAGFGSADLAAAEPAAPETAYLWFSLSKLVTATAALVLADQGRLDLAAPAREYLPYLTGQAGAQPTVRQLIDHTSGLSNPMPLRWVHAAGAAAPDPEALLVRLLARRRAFRQPPGRSARYSNLGYLALGQVVSVAAQLPFERQVRETVLDPAGMCRTGFRYPVGSHAATGYVHAPRLAVPVLRAVLPAGVAGHRTQGHLSLNRFYVDGPAYGGLIGDVLDAGRFLTMHLNDGEIDGHRVLSAGTAARMRQIDRPGTPFAHGLGWFRQPGPGSANRVEHLGAGAGFWNVMCLYPERGLGVVMMANTTRRYDVEPVMARVLEGPCS